MSEGFYIASNEAPEGATSIVGHYTEGGHNFDTFYVDRATADSIARLLTESTGLNWYATPRGWHLARKD